MREDVEFRILGDHVERAELLVWRDGFGDGCKCSITVLRVELQLNEVAESVPKGSTVKHKTLCDRLW